MTRTTAGLMMMGLEDGGSTGLLLEGEEPVVVVWVWEREAQLGQSAGQ